MEFRRVITRDTRARPASNKREVWRFEGFKSNQCSHPVECQVQSRLQKRCQLRNSWQVFDKGRCFGPTCRLKLVLMKLVDVGAVL